MRLAVILLLLFISNLYGQADLSAKYSKSITSKELKELLYVYASDYFEGRDTGERGQKIAVDFLRNYYQKQNIEAAISDDADYMQKTALLLGWSDWELNMEQPEEQTDRKLRTRTPQRKLITRK